MVTIVLKRVENPLEFGVVVVNALFSSIQEWRAERAILALRSMTAPRAQVVRDGRQRIIPAREVVPGLRDVVHDDDADPVAHADGT